MPVMYYDIILLLVPVTRISCAAAAAYGSSRVGYNKGVSGVVNTHKTAGNIDCSLSNVDSWSLVVVCCCSNNVLLRLPHVISSL